MGELRKKLRVFVFIALTTILAFTFYNLFIAKPEILNLESLAKIPRQKEVRLLISPKRHVEKIEIVAIQGGREVLLFEGDVPRESNEIRFILKPRELGLKDGEAQIVVRLTRLFLLRSSFEVSALIDTQPPRLHIVHAPYSVLQGGSGAIRVKATEPVELSVEVGKRSFRFYEVKDKTYVSLFAVPPDISEKAIIKIVASDDAGNKTVVPLGTSIKRNRFKTLRIELKGREEALVPKLSSILGGDEYGDFIALFKEVNERVRAQNEATLLSIGAKSIEEKLWEGSFLQMKNSKVISRYGEKRVYTYNGKVISESRHMGYDLASVKNAPVPAANHGLVVFAGDLGIYGNTLVIDHGFGLMSVYSHLADFKVKEGDKVKKGQIIGFTDTTGLAFGDHLHFGILINGYEVTPLEWWDPKWVRTRIEPAFTD